MVVVGGKDVDGRTDDSRLFTEPGPRRSSARITAMRKSWTTWRSSLALVTLPTQLRHLPCHMAQAGHLIGQFPFADWLNITLRE